MTRFVGIRETASSYDIYPVEEREEGEEEFVPYSLQRIKLRQQSNDCLQHRRVRTELSASLDCKDAKITHLVRLRRSRTISKDGPDLFRSPSLQVNAQHNPLPQVIHSKRIFCQPSLERSNSKKNKLQRLQSDMKRHKPVFFNEKVSFPSNLQEKPIRVLDLNTKPKNSVFLFEASSKGKGEGRNLPINRRELKKLMMVYKMGTTASESPPPKLDRSCNMAKS